MATLTSVTVLLYATARENTSTAFPRITDEAEIVELTRLGPPACRPTINAEFLVTVSDWPLVSVAVTEISYIPETKNPELDPPAKLTDDDAVQVPSSAVPDDLLKLKVPLDHPVSPTE